MVRALQKETSEDGNNKKESTKKKIAAQKRKPESGVWPCKINGCNKQFAREADLKRHQRTTKIHSLPSFACPQCDANFTRTDALRRHQKSRHNGIVIEPGDHDNIQDGDGGPQGDSQSKSRSTSPSRRDDEKGSATSVHPTYGGSAQAPGPSSYYRQHTMDSGPYGARAYAHGAQPVVTYVPSHAAFAYSQGVALPTSATRLSEAQWAPPPWSAAAAPPGPVPYPYPPGVIPSTGYYPNVLQPVYVRPPIAASASNSTTPQAQPSASPERVSDASSAATSEQQLPDSGEGSQAAGSEGQESNPPSSVDPSLVDSCAQNADADVESISAARKITLDITKAAMEAVLQSAQAQQQESGQSQSQSSPHSSIQQTDEIQVDELLRRRHSTDSMADDMVNSMKREDIFGDAGYDDSGRPPPMEQMLTEDGEPMLNPAELLTQESLASPPPS